MPVEVFDGYLNRLWHSTVVGNLRVLALISLFGLVTCMMSLLLFYSQFTVTAADGLKLKSRAARFADTLVASDSPKARIEPLVLTRPNVSFV